MIISDCMKRNAIFVTQDCTVQEAAQLMSKKHIGTLPVVDEESRLVGIIGMRDLISLAMPGYVQLFESLDYIRDFGALEDEEPEPEILLKPVRLIMCDPVYVVGTSGLIRGITLLQQNKLDDLPVVDEDMHLVGIASKVDIGVAIIARWHQP